MFCKSWGSFWTGLSCFNHSLPFSFLAIWDLFRCFMSLSLRLHGWLLPLCRLFATRDQISVPTPVQTARFLSSSPRFIYSWSPSSFFPLFVHSPLVCFWQHCARILSSVLLFCILFIFFFSVSVPHLLQCPIYLFGLWSRRNSLQQEGPFPRASQLLLAYHAVSSLKS